MANIIKQSTGSTSNEVWKKSVEWDEDEYLEYGTGRSKKIDVPPGIHIMNRNERRELNKLKIKTGLSEEEIRKDKNNRIKLSKAQKAKGDKDDRDRYIIDMVKSVTKELKLAVDHPSVIEKLKEQLSKPYGRWKNRWGFPTSTEILIREYKKLRSKDKKKNKKVL